MIDPIRIHHADDDDAARERHEAIEKRLDELGPSQVGLLVASGGLPTGWNPIIREWLAGKRLGTPGV